MISLFAGAGLLLPLIAVQYGSAIFTVLYFGFSFCFGVPFGLIPTAFVADIVTFFFTVANYQKKIFLM